jgi:outer membrane immunogenic protein
MPDDRAQLAARGGQLMKGRQMRWVSWVICALAVLAAAPRALAQDFDILRGSESVGPATFTNWTGLYLGGHLGYTDTNADFSNSTQAPIAYVLRDTAIEVVSHPSDLPALGVADSSGLSYGAFVGFNSNWQNLMLGVEANFNHTTTSLNAPSVPIARSAIPDGDGDFFTVGIAATGTMADLNYFEIRGRAGLILGGGFLPYFFIGPAVGVANINVNASVVGTCDPGSKSDCGGFAFEASAGRNSAIIYGGAVGGGIDYAVTQNVFLRGEFEYLRFAEFDDITVSVSSIRIGAGYKF